jgi:hypothetical protein
VALLEMLPAVHRDRYRLAFRLKVEPGPGGRAGFYCFHQIVPTALGPRHLFLSTSLADNGVWKGRCQVEYELYHEDAAFHGAMPQANGAFTPVPQGWHFVELAVSPEAIHLNLDNQEVGQLRQDDLDWAVGRVQKDYDDQPNNPPLRIPPLDRASGLGLYVNNSIVWYRELILTPE